MYLRAFAAMSLLAVLVGCGPDISSVSGTVTLDGTPQPNLIVAFSPVDGGTSAAGTTDASGKYSLSSNLGAGLPAGDYKVSITTQTVVDEEEALDDYETQGSDSAAYASQNEGDNYRDAQKNKEKVPAKYNKQTTLTETVTDGSNEINFELTTGE